MLKPLSIALFLLACSFVSTQCSPLTWTATTLDSSHLDADSRGLPTTTYLTSRNAFAVVLSSTREIINLKEPCGSRNESLSQFEINDTLALTYTLASELLSYGSATEGEDESFDFIVFVDERISRHQKRHLRQIGVKVHQIKATQVHSHARSRECPRKPLICDNIEAKEDFIRSSNDIDVSDYENIVLLDPHVIAHRRLPTIFSDVIAQPLLNSRDVSIIPQKADSDVTLATTELLDLSTYWAFQWMLYLLESQDQPKRTTEPAQMFPRRETVKLRKSAADVLNHYAITGRVTDTEYTTWEMCLT